MASTKFSRRFKELVADMSDTELGFILGVSASAAQKMRNGDIKSLKLQAALRLAKELQISPWYLGGEPEPVISSASSGAQKVDDKTLQKSISVAASQRKTSGSVPILHDEVTELRARVSRLEAALKKLQSAATIPPHRD
jgi:hypothetical protein